MLKVLREGGTDYLFAGLLEKELVKHDFLLDKEIFVEPNVGGEIHFSQDWPYDKEHETNTNFMFYTQPSYRDKYEEIFKDKCALVTYAADPNIHKPLELKKTFDVGFLGEGWGDKRTDYINAIVAQSDIKFYVDDNKPGEKMAELLSRCKILFNHIRFVDVNLRFFETMALGCQVVNRKPYLSEFATEGIHYMGYSSPEECVAVIKRLLQDDDLRNRIAFNARSHFLSNHTYAHRATAIINHLTEAYVHT